MTHTDAEPGARFLLGPSDPPPVGIVNPAGASPFLLLGDHAGRSLPTSLGTMGLIEDELLRHIGWDIGVRRLGEHLAEALDAVFIHQCYSRLVVDCNRDPEEPTAIPAVSDGTKVPANDGLTEQERGARFDEVHEPYHRAIAAELERRVADRRETVLISLHSFTPALRIVDRERPWQIGVLHDQGDVSFAGKLLSSLRAEGNLVVGDNEPYAMLGIDYTVPRHAYPTGLPYAELEIRQDLLERELDVLAWSKRLSECLLSVERRALHRS